MLHRFLILDTLSIAQLCSWTFCTLFTCVITSLLPTISPHRPHLQILLRGLDTVAAAKVFFGGQREKYKASGQGYQVEHPTAILVANGKYLFGLLGLKNMLRKMPLHEAILRGCHSAFQDLATLPQTSPSSTAAAEH